MPTKSLRIVRDSKYTGTFSRSQIERAIRTVEREAVAGGYGDKGRNDTHKICGQA